MQPIFIELHIRDLIPHSITRVTDSNIFPHAYRYINPSRVQGN